MANAWRICEEMGIQIVAKRNSCGFYLFFNDKMVKSAGRFGDCNTSSALTKPIVEGSKMADRFKACIIEDCNGNADCHAGGRKGWCCAHYKRWKRHGDPLGGGTFYGAPMEWLATIAVEYQSDECLEWPFSRSSAGYGGVSIDGEMALVHRWICQKFHGDAPSKRHDAAHSCGRGHLGCINHRHLRWATRKENLSDMVEHGTYRLGEQCSVVKLTECDVREIRERCAGGETQQAIADHFGVCRSNVSSIFRRKSWAWLDEGLR